MNKQTLGIGALIILFSSCGVYLTLNSLHAAWLTAVPNQNVELMVKWAYGYFICAILSLSLAGYLIFRLIRKIRGKGHRSYLEKGKRDNQ